MVGAVLAWTQRALSFHSIMPPCSYVYRRNGGKAGVEFSRPGLLPFVLIFIPRRTGYDAAEVVHYWYSCRAGWRWDGNWGHGGYIADVIVKLSIDNLAE